MRRQLTLWFVGVAVVILALVMAALNAGVWYRMSHMHAPGVPGRMMGPGPMMPGPGGGGRFGLAPAYLETWMLTLRWSLIAGVIGVGLAVAASLLVAERITRSLRRLAETARAGRPVAVAFAAQPFAVQPADAAEIRDLAEALNRMTERLQAEDQARRNLFADVAHELRHPIALIRGKLEMVLDGVAPMAPESISGLQDEVIRLGRLVGDLQDLSLAEVGALSLNLREVNLAAELQRVQENFDPVAAGKNIQLVFECGAHPHVQADPDRFRQILANLVSNAIRHTPEGGRIRVDALTVERLVVIRVEDTGPGIAAADLPYIFDRFYRADKSRTRATGGTGLGLPIARSLARLHGGELAAANGRQGGACFTLTLPAGSQP